MDEKLLSCLRYIGEKKWRAYLFWYLFEYLSILWHVLSKTGGLPWGTLFPLKLFPVFIACCAAPVNYKAVQGIVPQMWIIKRCAKLSISFLIFLVMAALIEKEVHCELLWLIW